MNPQMKFVMVWIMPVISVLVTASQPAAIQLAFVVTTVWGALQSFLLRNQTVRRILRITPLYVKNNSNVIDVKPRSSVQTFKYEAPKPAPGSKDYEPEHKDLYWRMKKGVTGIAESGKKRMQDAGLAKKDESGLPRRMTSKFKEQAQRYEEKRQEELKREKKIRGKR